MKTNRASLDFWGNIVALLVIIPLLLYWYNHVWFQHPMIRWHYFVYGFVWWLVTKMGKEIMYAINGSIFVVSLIAQGLHWMGFIHFPVVH